MISSSLQTNRTNPDHGRTVGAVNGSSLIAASDGCRSRGEESLCGAEGCGRPTTGEE